MRRTVRTKMEIKFDKTKHSIALHLYRSQPLLNLPGPLTECTRRSHDYAAKSNIINKLQVNR